MTLAKTGLIIGALGIAGYVAYDKFVKKEVDNQNIPNESVNNQTTSTIQNEQNNTSEIPVFVSSTHGTVLNSDVGLDENLIKAFEVVYDKEIEGSQVSNIIHGGSLENTFCAYRGTNGKCYSSYDEAKFNGAV